MRFIKELQQQVRNFFGISSTEANAFLILLPLMTILLVLFPFYHHLFAIKVIDFSADKEQLQQYIANLEKPERENHEKNHPEKRFISSFDPNTAPFSDLILAGLDTSAAATLIKFRNTGAVFHYKEDITAVYGIDDETFMTIKPKIALPDAPVSENSLRDDSYERNRPEKIINKSEIKEDYKIPAIPNFNINIVDSTALMEIKGIGPVLSSRIIRYREKLGGFVDTAQYKEVFGVKGEALEQLRAAAVIEKDFKPGQLNINKSGAKELAGHPYLSWAIANAIVSYRQQHGNYKSLEQLQNIKIIDSSRYEMIKPYLSL